MKRTLSDVSEMMKVVAGTIKTMDFSFSSDEKGRRNEKTHLFSVAVTKISPIPEFLTAGRENVGDFQKGRCPASYSVQE